MQKPKKTAGQKPKITLAQALDLVLSGEYRRIDVDFTDARGDKYNCSIYQCANNMTRCDFKKA